MGDLPFIVYFDFETMTGDSVINDKKNVCYQLLSNICVQPIAKSSKNCSLRSFKQNFEEITSLNRFSQEHITFFDQVTMAKMKDAATKVFNREKTTAQLELSTIKLKFTIDTLVNWFNSVK